MPSSSPPPLPFSNYLLFSVLASPLFLVLFSSSPISADGNNINTSIVTHKTSSSTHPHQACVQEHLSALLQLKRGFNFSDSFINLSSWNANDADCCSWEGITCNTYTGHVVGLDLSSRGIEGVFDFESLFLLRSLRRLDLSGNQFDASPIPSGFGQLRSLTHLNLAQCSFYGQIPQDFSNLIKLVSLDLSYNRYDNGSNYAYLDLESSGMGEIFRNLSSLRELNLDKVNMSAVGSQWSRILPYSLPNLRKLSMHECGLSGPIHPSLSRLRFLTDLDLGSNDFSSPVPKVIANFTSLTSLTLSHSDFRGEFPKGVFSLPKLQTMDISGNQFLTNNLPKFSANSTIQQLTMSETEFHGNLTDFLSNFKSLTHLYLRGCKIFGPMPQSLGNLTQLVNLVLSDNSIQGPIPMQVFELIQLEHLNLSHNSLSSIINARNISRLARFYLANNNFQGAIPRPIFELTELTDLDLSSNNFSGVLDLGLFQNSKNLSRLDLSYNSLTAIIDSESNSTSTSLPHLSSLLLRSCKISKFPDMLRNQEEMLVLDLSCNRISGKIPEWIWAVGNGGLSFLNLSNNALEGLEGSFPHLSLTLSFLDLSANVLKGPALIPPPSSRFFSLANNALDGEVPSLICNATSLQVLDLSGNNFTGPIPQCLGEISDFLVLLNLRKNAFRGPLLQTFKEGCSLKTLDLSDNQLEGQMPESLANCQQLTDLNLGNNQILDTFPSHLANLSDLRVLLLKSNKFYGSIGRPSTSQAFFSQLQIIDVSFNNFNGSLPSSLFSDWKIMKDGGSASEFLGTRITYAPYYPDRLILVSKGLKTEFPKILFALTVVDLSHNQFHGDIPSSIGELKSLLVLNMSHNHFQGIIPPSLGNITELESLDLSQNSLSGKIPWQLTNLSFLAVLDLSQNQLTGSIPQGRQFNTFENDSFLGNPGLCGPPLSRKCVKDAASPPPTQSDNKSELDMMWIGFGVGHAVGFGIFFWTLVLWRKARHAFFAFVDRVFLSILIFAKRCGV